MHHYVDVHVHVDPELPANQVLSALYSKFHRATVRLGDHGLAVSFPRYSLSPMGLGNCLRLIGSEKSIAHLLGLNWLQGVEDHVVVHTMTEVPTGVEWRNLRRIQAKSNPERLRRRQMRRHGLTDSEVLQRIPDTAAERLRLPFLTLFSTSTGHPFRMYLRLEVASEAQSGHFNSFGLSSTAAIPWF